MTEKKEKILEAALELFAEEGYKVTSTSKVAKRAKVSEGLIFRHFTSKEGLLKAILDMGEEKAKLLFADIIQEQNPIEVLRKTLDMADHMAQNESEFSFWKLQYKIKWELADYGAHKLEPFQQALTEAFRKLGYKNPAMEATRMGLEIDGIATRMILQKSFDAVEYIQFLRSHYQL